MDTKKLSFVAHILTSQGYSDLSASWIHANKIQTYLSSLVLQEMRSLSLNESYWSELHKGEAWEVKLFNLNRFCYQKFTNIFTIKRLSQKNEKNSTFFSILEDSKSSEILNTNIQLLKKNFDECLLILGLLSEANKFLDLIYSVVLNSNSFLISSSNLASDTSNLSSESVPPPPPLSSSYDSMNSSSPPLSSYVPSLTSPLPSTSIESSSPIISSILNESKEILLIKKYFFLWYKQIISLFFHYFTSIILFSTKINHQNYKFDNNYEENLSIQKFNILLFSFSSHIENIYHENIYKKFPLKLITSIDLPPSSLEMYWIRIISSSFCIGIASNKLYTAIINGSIEKFIEKSMIIMKNSIQEHVREPLEKILDYFFNTINAKNDLLISQNELYNSQISLQNMLKDFVSRVRINPVEISKRHNFDEDDLKLITDYRENFSLSFLNSKENIPLMPPDVLEKHLSVLMNVYEEDLSHPIQGMLKGELLSALLIQVQKLKVHTERVMLTLDQLLESNKINLAVVSAIPAFFLVYFGFSWLKTRFQPKVYSAGEATIRFRMILSDVERALFRNFEAKNKLETIKGESKINQNKEESDLETPKFDFDQLNLPVDPLSSSYKKLEYFKSKGLVAYHMMRFHSKFCEIYKINGVMNLKQLIQTGIGQREPKFLLSNFENLDFEKEYDTLTNKNSSFYSSLKSSFFSFIPFNIYDNIIIKRSTALVSYSFLTVYSLCRKILMNLTLSNSDKASMSLQYDSLVKDIELLESSDHDLSVEAKMKIITRMRQTYKVFKN